ncbi:hypothetical protein Golob_017851 [Gossypium lobatum]|uniref:RNase H type-1 domain-containing protein n=1 Tax=Gossypium lobatum TaxID=34289 RepID=A0A7J8M8F4_9ROSI|nr:hypothetical protein [Gossypium lobatum]
MTDRSKITEQIVPIGNIFYSKTVLHANISSPFATEAMAYFQAVLTGAQMCFLNVEVEGDCLSVIHNALATEGLKRNEATYLVGDVPAYALDAIEVDRI